MSDQSDLSLATEQARHAMRLDDKRVNLDWWRFFSEIIKWLIIAVGAVISFVVIDEGKLQLEQFKARSEDRRDLLRSYLAASTTTQPDVWERELKIIAKMTDDQQLHQWTTEELDYIKSSAARDALYRETLKVASQLVEPAQLADPDRKQLGARFNQLYWAELPFVDESDDVENAMVQFRENLQAAEKAGADDTAAWSTTDGALLSLSRVLAASTGVSVHRQSATPGSH